MTKTKIFLTVITVLAVVGGVVAFKAKIPKQFYQCDVPAQLCRINPTILPYFTTQNCDVKIPYDELNKPCKFIAGIWTCETCWGLE